MSVRNRLSQLLGVDAGDVNAVMAGLVDSQLPLKVAKIPIKIVAATTVNDTGFDYPTKGIVLDTFVDCVTAEATGTTKTIEVGLLASESGGDEDGFIDAVSVASTGVKPGALPTTDGTNTNFFTAAPTLGVLMYDGLLGADAAATPGVLSRRPHVLNGTAKSLTYTLPSTNWAEFVGSIITVYVDLA